MFPDFLQAYPDIRLDAHFLDRRVDIVAEGFDAVIRLETCGTVHLTGRELGAFLQPVDCFAGLSATLR